MPRQGTTPAEFIRFFEVEFSARLKHVEIPGMDNPWWDRRAAWLLWQARGRAEPADRYSDDVEALL